MANQHSSEGSSSGNVAGESSDSTVEINIKTLDSQIYSFQVEKNMPVSLFKEKIANQIGVPVGQQRLIFRGKVLKDDHPLSEYHLENGHTLHLVIRQPSQSQPSSGTSSGDPHVNNGNEASGVPRGRIGQISHSVVLGTFNVGDQGEGIVPDLSRVIGAVLNSIGVGTQATTNVTGNLQSTTSVSNSNNSGQSPHGNDSEGLHNVIGPNRGGNQAQSGQAFPAQPFQTFPQAVQSPAAAAFPIPSLNMPIPDSLNTLSEFMNRMEQALTQNGYQPNLSATNTGDVPRVNLPSNAQGMPTPEALGIVLRHAERLLSSHAVSALSRIAGRLEQEGASSDPSVRGQIQTEFMQVGLAMQHLGALFLELGRTIWTLRMGQSPGEAVVNAGPAVYISPSGPNPIMVQPFPLQTSTMFGGSVPQSNPMTFGPVGVGSAPRNVNIHIHAGTSLAPIVSAVGARGSNGEGMPREHRNGSGSRDSGARGLPVRNVIAATMPTSQTGVSQPGLSASQLPSDSSLSSIVSELNSHIRNFVGNMQGEDTVQSGQEVPNVQSSSVGFESRNDATSERPSTAFVDVAGQSSVPLPGCASEGGGQKDSGSVPTLKDDSRFPAGGPLSSSSGQNYLVRKDEKESGPQSSEKHDMTEGTKAVPLGLGLGILDRKRQGRQQKPKNGDGGMTNAPINQNQQVTGGQQVLQSLASRGSAVNRMNTGDAPARQTAPAIGQVRDGRTLGAQGVSEQTGAGSPDALRNMLQNFTQSPQMRNAVNQIAEQVDSQDIGNMFAGLGGGQGGGIDMSRMFQQMMPIVSRALGAGVGQPNPVLEPESHPPYNERSLSRDDNVPNPEINLQEVVQRIGNLNAPGDVFHAVVENAVELSGRGSGPQELVDELCGDDGLSREYVEILQRDIRRRLEGNSGQDKC
ncbi:large proline-rich protein BAG6 isoform X5 [Prunus avium]|uniref:Large proline-rich protein BAG6 isoform X5 n=2 Tax=Prunus avium TaxID=42229 RepID=A0A6P5RNK9_PRUAV|nr:large proline-rich protein BAG6 isoform X5 [Prunus avium]